MRLYKKFLTIKKIEDLTMEELVDLEMNDYEPPTGPKYPNGVVNFLILDDLIGSDAFKSTGKSALTNMVLKNRHLGINVLICTQNLKSIPKSIRTYCSLFVIFRFASQKIVCEDLWEEVSNLLKIEQFEQLYDLATSDPHDALVLDFTQPRGEQIKKNHSIVLSIS
jgi:hypothetical protein